MSSEKSDSFLPKSNAFKNILNKPKEEPKSLGKEEFLARRKFFLQKLESEGGIPKPKPLTNNTTKNKISNERLRATFKPLNVTNTTVEKNEKISLPDHEWSISSAKSESLRKIIDLAGKQETNTVGKSIFNARQKFFADSQLSSVEQLMPRPSTPPGYCYLDRCPSPSLEPRRNSYSAYTSSSPVFGSSSNLTSNPTPIIAPSPKPASFSLPWEQADNKNKDIIQPKPQKSVNIIKSLENVPIVSDEIIKLPDPVNFTKEALSLDEPISIKTEKNETTEPMVAKIIVLLPEPVQFNTENLSIDEPLIVNIINVEVKPSLPKHIIIEEELPESAIFTKEKLPNDEPIDLNVNIVEIPKMYVPKMIYILPEPISATKEFLPQDELLDVEFETVISNEAQTPEIISIMPEPITITNELLPQDQPLEIKTVYVTTEEKKIPENIHISENLDEIDNELKSNVAKTMDISSLTLESNIEEKNSRRKNSDGYLKETQPLLDTNSEISESKSDSIDENQPLLDSNNNNDFNNDIYLNSDDENDDKVITKKSSVSSITELLNSNGTLSLDEPLPIKSIPIYQTEDNVDLIELSDSDNLSDEVKNWFSVVDTAIANEENNNQ